jgi:predicted O-methyltransferase YrrM
VDASAGNDSVFDEIGRFQDIADYVIPLMLRAVCDLRIADLLCEGARSVDDLAAKTGTQPGPLYRVLRALAARGVFDEVSYSEFALTPMAEFLRADHPLSLRDGYPLLPADLQAWALAEWSLRTGKSAFEQVHGEPYYAYLIHHRDYRESFIRSCEAQNRVVLRSLAPAYGWSQCGTIVDVGGGNGAFIAGLLARNPAMRGVLFDLPHVVANASAVLNAAGVADRCTVVAGDFFEAMAQGYDTYLLKTILHDWSDERAAVLLRSLVQAMRPDSRLLVLEALIAPGNEFHLGKLLDVNSLVLAGGIDRTEEELERLLAAAGLELTRSIPTTSTLAILEARPVGLDAGARGA